ncbi:MAG: hypothetical protein M1834_003348 [Cirrosporium novae-zelandiae]|nr:MAG: hypothetical protein M1834_003348 [Cirrosporium novae-zelandiae]
MLKRVEVKFGRFEELYPVITNIRKSFGAASISCEVLHEGKVVFLHGEGFADVEKNLKPDENTVYCVALTQKLLQQQHTYLPEFHTVHDPEISNRATLLDLCSHGTGLAPLDHIVCGFHDEFYNPGKEQVKIASHLLVCYDFRSRWLYNNTLLGIVSDVIAKVSGTTSDTVLENKIFKPLGMTRSCTKNENYPADGNFARGYAVLDDYSLHPLELPALNDGSLQAGAGYVRSSVRDMLTWEKAVMDAETETEQVDGNHPLASSSLSSNPLKQMQFIRYAHRPMTLEASEYENSYGLGWFRHMLPSSWLGSIGPNFALLPDPPVMNQDGPPRLTIAHYGEFNGFTTAFYTFPDSCSAIVVMANCTPSRGDPADLIAQALCQSLFDMQPHVDYESYAKSAAQTSSLIWPALVEEWVSNRVQHTKAAPLEEYIGSYANEGFSFTIDVYRLSESKVDSQIYLKELGSEERLRMPLFNDLTKLETYLDKHENSLKRNPPRLKKVIRLSRPVAHILDNIHPGLPRPASMIRGILGLVAEATLEIPDIMDFILGIFDDLLSTLHRYDSYIDLIPDSPDLHLVIMDVYQKYISVGVLTVKNFRHRSFRMQLRRLRELKAKVEQELNSAHFLHAQKRNREANAAAMGDVSRLNLTERSTSSKQLGLT